jgi:UDP-N-acetylglucosamine acyltransferase
MSKLIDSLTGYFFSGDTDRPAADSSLDELPRRRESGPDAALVRERSTPVASHVAARIRSRLRKPVRRDADSGWGDNPWGDKVDSPRIHPSAHVDPRADLAPDVEVGPFCVIGPHVSLGPGCRLLPHATILGHTTCGSDNTFHPFCVVGGDPQDKKFAGEDTFLVLGDGNDIREHVTIHTGTHTGGGTTRVGDHNLIMVGAHIGHDATVGNRCVIGNNVMLAGHVVLGNRISMMGGSAVHHFVTIGDYAFIGGYAQIHADVPPYVKVDGEDEIRTVNIVGLRRSGEVSDTDIAALEVAAKTLFLRKKQPLALKMEALEAESNLNPRVKQIIDSIRRRDLGKHGRYLEGLRRG